MVSLLIKNEVKLTYSSSKYFQILSRFVRNFRLSCYCNHYFFTTVQIRGIYWFSSCLQCFDRWLEGPGRAFDL